jgi:phage terminase large subunit-like protein
MDDFPTQGDNVIRFTETFLTLGGSFVGQPFIPLDWMKETIRDIYRLDPETGKRRHRTYLLGVPRKNAKSTIGAALAVYMLCIDTADSNPQVISAAGDRKQAKLVFDEAKRMIQASPELSEICTIFRDEIRCSRTGGTYRAVSADAGLAHGLNPSCVIVDEYHVHKNDELYVALTTGSATRNQPLTLVITTAGHDLESPLGKLYQYGRRVESGEVDDPSFGFRWYGPKEDEEYDPSDPTVWERFNPSWSIMNPDEFASANKSTHESQFIRYRLNGWTSAESVWLPHGAWDRRFSDERPLAPGDEVILGFDGSWKGDSTALVAVRLDDLHVSLIGLWESPMDDPHWRVPAEDVKEAIRQACRTYTAREVVCDPFRFEQSLMDLMDEGFPIVEYPTNSLARMVPATQSFYDSVMDEGLTHDGNPALARHLGNAVLKEDAKGARITKPYRSSSKHIDAAVAAVIGHHRARQFKEAAVNEPQMLVL